MATKSSVLAISNFDATPKVINDSQLVAARMLVVPFTYEKVAGNTDADQIQLARCRSDWMLKSCEIAWDAMAGLTSVNLGIWSDDPPASASEWDKDCYAATVDPHVGAALTQYAFTTRDKANTTKRIWEDLAAGPGSGAFAPPTKDPKLWMRLALDLTTGGTAVGSIAGYASFLVPG